LRRGGESGRHLAREGKLLKGKAWAYILRAEIPIGEKVNHRGEKRRSRGKFFKRIIPRE